MAISDGDILSALTGLKTDTGKISATLSDMSEKDIHQIQQDLSTLVRISQGTRRYEENDRFQRDRDERSRNRQYRQNSEWRYSPNYSDQFTRSSQGTSRYSSRSRSSFSTTSKSQFDGVVDEFLSSISESIQSELKKSVADSPIHKQIKGYIKKFADDLGIKVSEIPSELGKELGKYVIRNTKFGQQATSVVRNIENQILQNVVTTAKQGASRYVKSVKGKNASFTDIYDQFVAQYRETHKVKGSRIDDAESTFSRNPVPGSSDELLPLVSEINHNVALILHHLENQSRSTGRRHPESSEPDSSQGTGRKIYSKARDLSYMYSTAKDAYRVGKASYDALPDDVKLQISSKVSKYASKALGSQSNALLGAGASSGEGLIAAGQGALTTTSGSAIVTTGGNALASTAGGSAAVGALGGPVGILAAMAAMIALTVVVDKLSEAFGPAIDGIKKFGSEAKKVTNRFYNSQKEMIKTEQERIEQDVKTMAQMPFEIMNRAAQEWYDAWDNKLKTIGQTQGYTKADVQTLFTNYAERLRSEGLSSIISAADISSNLGSVIESGLSGKAAEEFAYKATLLNNAIPNQDFFSYSDTYAQIVGNALSRGLSESSAIQEANNQLEQFASNLIYADRQISSGVSTALKNGSQLFADAVKIANTARTGDSTKISGVLTAVAAEVGAIAPDLASDIVSNVVQAAVGGNNSDLVALRSMAGIGASNTAFIKALAQNPQQVFTSLFSNLANMQNLGNDNYMEVAESLSQTFGISASAFARIDFNALAQAISSMRINNAALSENLNLLKSGETTQSAEMLKMQQINQMIIDEGLAYVLDNEAARQIQQHMWDQELANEIMEREYSVDFAGSAKEMIQGIFETIHNILKFLNPFSWIGDLINIAGTAAEYGAQKSDLRSILEAGKVGQGNSTAFRNLTNYNGSSLNSVPSLMDMLGMKSAYQSAHGALNLFNSLTDVGSLAQLGLGILGNSAQTALTSYQSKVNSKYTWGFVGKSLAKAIASSPMNSNIVSSGGIVSSSDAIRQREAEQINSLLGTMDAAVKSNKSYDQWKSEVTKQYKISDFGQALSGVGLSEAEARGQFEAKEAQKVSQHNYEREKVEDTFWEDAIQYYTVNFPYYSVTQLERMQTQIDWQNRIYDEIVLFHNDTVDWWKLWIDTTWKKDWVDTTWKKDWITTQWTKGFLSYWTDIFVKFDTYSKSTHNAYKAIDEVKDKDKKKESGDAVLALAKALTDNTAELRDPTVQTNALLAQILIVAEAILQAENTSGGASLQTSLSALGLGLTTSDTSVPSTTSSKSGKT